MPRPARPAKPKAFFALVGRAEVPDANLKEMLDDYIDKIGDGVTPYFLFSGEKDDLTETALALAAYATEAGYPYAVAYTKAQRSKIFKDLVADAATTLEATEGTVYENLLADVIGEHTDDARILYAASDDPESLAGFWAYADGGVVGLDFTGGLQVIPLDDPDADAGADVGAEETHGDDALPPRKEANEYPIRRIRTLASQFDADGKSAEWIAGATSAELLAWIYEDDENGEPEPEPEPVARPARAVRKSAEDAGETPNAGAVKALRGRGRAAKAEPDEAQAEMGSPDASGVDDDVIATIVRATLEELGNVLADQIIERVAAHVSELKNDAPERGVIAPRRRAGRPRSED